MELVSNLGTGFAFAFYLTFCFNSMPKPASLYFWCGIMFANFILNQLKSAYEEPRPSWVSDEIPASKCRTSFGNPSGHMLGNCFFWVSVYLHLFYDRMIINNSDGSTSFWNNRSVQFFITIFLTVFLGLMAISRVYLGAHTLNEVLFGTLLGVTIATIAHFRVKTFFYAMPEMLYSREEEEKYDINRWTYIKAILATFVIPMSIASLTLFLRYGDSEEGLYTSEVWLKRMKNCGCTKEDLDPALILHNKHFEHSVIIANATGAVLGQLFEH